MIDLTTNREHCQMLQMYTHTIGKIPIMTQQHQPHRMHNLFQELTSPIQAPPPQIILKAIDEAPTIHHVPKYHRHQKANIKSLFCHRPQTTSTKQNKNSTIYHLTTTQVWHYDLKQRQISIQ